MPNEQFTLGIIIGSIRPGRIGPTVAEWVAHQAETDGRFTVDLIDLAALDLPVGGDGPAHPLAGQYVHEQTRAWSRRVAACQAFVIVTPEYNHGYPAALKNAVDLVNKEWWFKPVGFASYGGVSGGLRAVQQLKQVAAFLRMVPVAEALVAPFVTNQVVDGAFVPTDIQTRGTTTMLDELLAVGVPLRHLQLPSPVQG